MSGEILSFQSLANGKFVKADTDDRQILKADADRAQGHERFEIVDLDFSGSASLTLTSPSTLGLTGEGEDSDQLRIPPRFIALRSANNNMFVRVDDNTQILEATMPEVGRGEEFFLVDLSIIGQRRAALFSWGYKHWVGVVEQGATNNKLIAVVNPTDPLKRTEVFDVHPA